MPLMSTLSNASVSPTTALIPIWLSFSNCGISLFARDSFIPSIAWSTVLNSVAILLNVSLLPTLAMASKKSSVLILPSCTAWTISAVLMPISFAMAAIPAGVCSSISLKSCHWTLGLAAIWVACWLKVFMACCGFSAAAARPPNPLTSSVVFFVPTAANWE